MHDPFETDVYDHYSTGSTYKVPVIPHDSGTANGIVMEIHCSEEYAYITKEQAKAFFNLTEKE